MFQRPKDDVSNVALLLEQEEYVEKLITLTRSLAALELDALFEAGVPARQFRKTDVTSLDLSGHGHHAA